MVSQPVVVERTFTVDAPQDRAWAFFRNPASLSACIPGVSDVTALRAGTFRATVEVTISILKARFDTQVCIAEEQPPSCLVVKMSGKDGKTQTLLETRNTVNLVSKDGRQTEVTFRIDAKLTGKLAALGGGMAVKLKSRQIARAFALEVTQKIESEEG